MTLLLLLAGMILLFAGAGWFAGAATVGLILVVAGGLVAAVQLAVACVAARRFRRRDFR